MDEEEDDEEEDEAEAGRRRKLSADELTLEPIRLRASVSPDRAPPWRVPAARLVARAALMAVAAAAVGMKSTLSPSSFGNVTVSAVSEMDEWCIIAMNGRAGRDDDNSDDDSAAADDDEDDNGDADGKAAAAGERDDDDDDAAAALSDVSRDAADDGRICTANIPPKEEEEEEEDDDDDDDDDEEYADGEDSRWRPPVVADAVRR